MSDKRLLVALAHPDDESFGPGGTLARYASEGQVHLLCATRGEAGTVDDHLLQGYSDIAALRTAELECARVKLGVQSVEYLGYRDSGMAGSETSRHPACTAMAPTETVAAQVVAKIRQFTPQVVLTFDQYGGYGHPDHIAIQRATVLAFHAAGDASQFPDAGPPYQPQKLYYHSFSKRLLRLMVRLMTVTRRDPTRFGRNKDIDLKEIAGWEVPTTTRIDVRRYYDAKMAAAACHQSQGGGSGMWRQIPTPLRRHLLATETFFRVYPEVQLRAPVETDLFGGIEN
jgi:mycothiol S-conjugate amidase